MNDHSDLPDHVMKCTAGIYELDVLYAPEIGFLMEARVNGEISFAEVYGPGASIADPTGFDQMLTLLQTWIERRARALTD